MFKNTLSIILLILFSGTFSFAKSFSENPAYTKDKALLLPSEKNTIEIFKSSSPLVVSVDSTQIASDFFSMQYKEVPAGSGTGFLWDNKGHVITNFHVIQNVSRGSHIFITTKDGTRHKAKIVGSEPRKDIAVLKIKNFKPDTHGFSKKIADSKKLVVGQKVLAIGNPFGFDLTLTQGIISALNRSMPSLLQQYTIRGMIQTDASINPGNSGGPLINSLGELVGMNTSIISGSGSSAGIGFAVPSNTIKRIASQIIKHGEVIQPGLGITYIDGYGKNLLKRYYGYDIKGVIINEAKGNAKKAGIKGLETTRNGRVVLGDIITKVDHKEVDDIDDLYNILSEHNVGDSVNVGIKRQGKFLTKMVVLQKLKSPFSQFP